MALFERIKKDLESEKDIANPEIGLDYFDNFVEVKEKVHSEIIETFKTSSDNPGNKVDSQLYRDEITKSIEEILGKESINATRLQKERLAKEVFNDVAGLGPIEPLLADDTITEIMVNGAKKIYIERQGRIELSNVGFRDNDHVLQVIDRIVSSVGRHIDESSPMVDARLKDGSRVNAIIRPVSLAGPVLTIRKFARDPITVTDLVDFGSITPVIIKFLECCVKARLNIIVTGGTGSGKTTFLNILSGFIPESERIITIEDAAELQLRQEHIITLESRPSNTEGHGRITIRELVRNALRMRPDRMIVGEVRSGETLDMLQAMNTGHDGSMTTAHANSPRDVISRLETMVLMAGIEIPVKAIRQQISSALDLIIHQSRLRDGSRKIVSVTEVVGMEGDVVTLQDLFIYKGGKHKATGIYPGFVDKLSEAGVVLNETWFKK
ncbi:MAG: CpaF family protein [Clostridia bacterium]|jgi:pilus assembly protein CpaF|nr:CpaF family protein [Clostridia bacterium]